MLINFNMLYCLEIVIASETQEVFSDVTQQDLNPGFFTLQILRLYNPFHCLVLTISTFGFNF